jgi:methionine-rich copper-binding protein CopC
MIQKITKASVRIVVACAIALASSGAALAHAELHHASPEADSALSESPHEVTLTFTDTLEAAFSSADVTDSTGARVDEGKSQVSGNMIRISLKTLSPGSYRVHWRVVSVDSHRSEGGFTFSVGPVTETLGAGCGGKRYRDPVTHRCRGPSDFGH